MSTQVGTSNYIVNEIFQGNYQLLTTGGLGNRVATSGCNAPNTTDGCTAGVNMAVLAPIIQNTLNPSAGCSLFVTTVALPSGVINTSYSATLSASCGTPPYTWSITSGRFAPDYRFLPRASSRELRPYCRPARLRCR